MEKLVERQTIASESLGRSIGEGISAVLGQQMERVQRMEARQAEMWQQQQQTTAGLVQALAAIAESLKQKNRASHC